MTLLARQIENKSLSHAYIFEGKNTDYNLEYAREFAKNVFASYDVNIENDLNPDFYLINKEKEVIDIETIRAFIKDTSLRPANNKIKIYIIHNAQNMRVEGFNAILKTIEELKAYNIVVFTTNNAQALVATIRSRCQLIKIDKSDIDYDIDIFKLSTILADVYGGNINGFYQNKSFFEAYKEDRQTIIDGLDYIFASLIAYKLDLYKETTIDISYNLRKLAGMDFDKIDEIVSLLNYIRFGFKTNINYDLAIEKIIFNIYRGGMKVERSRNKI